jgi:Uma2 family endonuclease
MATVATPITLEEFLALPDDGVERWVVNGELRERDKSMTRRNRFHSRVMACLTTELENWNRQLKPPRGQVLTGDVGIVLHREPMALYGVDVAYVSSDVLTRQTEENTIIEGVPVLAVEILSPNDTVEDIHDKIEAYRSAGVPLVWIVDPYLKTLTVHRPDSEPELFTSRMELRGEPHLPGFRVPASRLFE